MGLGDIWSTDEDDEDEKEENVSSSDEILDAIGGLDRYLEVCDRISKGLRRDDLTEGEVIEYAIDAVSNIDSPHPLIFMELASRLPIGVDMDLAYAIMKRLPNDRYWILDDSRIRSWDVRPAIKNLSRINPPGFVEYLLSLATLVAVLENRAEILETILVCIGIVVEDRRHKENISILIDRLIKSPVDDLTIHIERLRDYDFDR